MTIAKFKQLTAVLFITCYVGWLSWGIMAHSLKVGLCGNTYSYFVVWDMFCGWSAWDSRTHIIAQDKAGNYFEMKEPWGEFQPFGNVGRIHYDTTHHLLPKQISNLTRNTVNDGFDRVYVIEEAWPKQYNLPPDLFQQYFDCPKDKLSYYHLKAVCTDQGHALTVNQDWYNHQLQKAVYDNPRIRKQAAAGSAVNNGLYAPVSSSPNTFSISTN